MPGAMPSAMSREAAAPSAAAPPRTFWRSIFARCVGEEQEQQAASAGDAYSCGQPAAAGDPQEVLQLRMQVAQMQAQMAARERAASEAVLPPYAGAVVTTENPFGFSKTELQKLSMTCDPAVLKSETTLILARLQPRSAAACQLLSFSTTEYETAMASGAASGARSTVSWPPSL